MHVSDDLAYGARVTARSMLFDLYGDFADEGGRGGAIPLGAIVRLASDLGFSETAARSAANRLVADDWLAAERHGRESTYALTPRGRRLVAAGRRRIFGRADGAWDGYWYVVALSVPEARRDVRDRMRKELSWLGFGSPSAGLYLSPHDHRPEVLRLAQELEAGAYVQVYHASAQWPVEPRELVARAWPGLGEIDTRYQRFQQRFRSAFAVDKVRAARDELAPAEAFRTRFLLVNQFRKCLFGDPVLPQQLLPADWQGLAARELFLGYHELISPSALAYFDAARAGRTPVEERTNVGA